MALGCRGGQWGLGKVEHWVANTSALWHPQPGEQGGKRGGFSFSEPQNCSTDPRPGP